MHPPMCFSAVMHPRLHHDGKIPCVCVHMHTVGLKEVYPPAHIGSIVSDHSSRTMFKLTTDTVTVSCEKVLPKPVALDVTTIDGGQYFEVRKTSAGLMQILFAGSAFGDSYADRQAAFQKTNIVDELMEIKNKMWYEALDAHVRSKTRYRSKDMRHKILTMPETVVINTPNVDGIHSIPMRVALNKPRVALMIEMSSVNLEYLRLVALYHNENGLCEKKIHKRRLVGEEVVNTNIEGVMYSYVRSKFRAIHKQCGKSSTHFTEDKDAAQNFVRTGMRTGADEDDEDHDEDYADGDDDDALAYEELAYGIGI